MKQYQSKQGLQGLFWSNLEFTGWTKFKVLSYTSFWIQLGQIN